MLCADRDVLLVEFSLEKKNVVWVACELKSDVFLFYSGLYGMVGQLVSPQSFFFSSANKISNCMLMLTTLSLCAKNEILGFAKCTISLALRSFFSNQHVL